MILPEAKTIKITKQGTFHEKALRYQNVKYVRKFLLKKITNLAELNAAVAVYSKKSEWEELTRTKFHKIKKFQIHFQKMSLQKHNGYKHYYIR